MSGRRIGLLVAIAWAITGGLLICKTDTLVVRTIAAVPLAVFLPGYASLAALGFAGRSVQERWTLAVALSISELVLGGLLLNRLHRLVPAGWAILLGTLIVVTALLGLRRCGAALPAEPRGVRRPRFGLAHSALLVVSAVIVVAAFGLRVWDTASFDQFRYTAFWMLPDNPTQPGILTIGARNNEGKPMDYEVVVTIGRRLLATWESVRLLPGQTFVRQIAVAVPPGRIEEAEARLFRSQHPSVLYRKVWVRVGGS